MSIIINPSILNDLELCVITDSHGKILMYRFLSSFASAAFRLLTFGSGSDYNSSKTICIFFLFFML